ncbi:MAG: FAD-dependent oxidoreductase [Bryobacterales bacterium]|nr:FAD-dependent oxidoreductase [Bryobacterales bacterium]
MRLAVIGGMGAGLSAASRARRVDPSLEIVVLERGDVISYAACGLPYYIEGRVPAAGELQAYSAERLRRERNIEIRTGAAVSEIRHARRELLLAGGERLGYDKLVIATGARPDTSVAGPAPLLNAFTLHTLDDAERIRRRLDERRPRRVVVVGAGYIGLEAADVLRARGLEVTLLEASRHVLGRPDDDVTAAVRGELARAGIELRLESPVRSLQPDRVNDIPCDMIVLATGLLPNVELAAAAGVRLGATGAIAVDERMETNLQGVFAAGDCAEALHLVTGRPSYIPLGTTANRMGRIAGACAAGARERFGGVAGTSIVKVVNLAVAATGLSPEMARKEGFQPASVSITALDRAKYFKGRPTTVALAADRRTHRLLGGAVIGEAGVAGRINLIAAALTCRMGVEDFGQLDLAYSPPFAPARDPVLVAAHELLKLLD